MSSDDTRESIEEEAEDSNDKNDDQIQQQQQQQQPQKQKKKKKKEEEEARIEFERKLKGAKNLIMLLSMKFQKACTRRKRWPPPVPYPYSEDLGCGGMGCHHLFFVQPRVSDPTHDSDDGLPPLRTNPDAKASSYRDFLRSLLERNDFYSPECNVHREI